MLDYLAIGHIAQDVAPEGYRLGGTVAYSALTAQALGLKAGIVTAAAPGAVMTGLEQIPVHIISSKQSTVFENIYKPEGRMQLLHSQAALLGAESIPAEWREAQIIHLGPIANEVDPALADSFPGAFIGLTPQGWMRQWVLASLGGRVVYRPWAEAATLLPKASATVIGIEDVQWDWSVAEAWAAQSKVFVVTQGEQGATVFANGERRHFEAPKVQVADATGAGDIFATSFFVRLWQSDDPWEAAKFAVAIASDSVTRVGIDGVPKSQ